MFVRKKTREERALIETGTKGRAEITVTKELTACAMGSGELEVFATPAMIALMEETAWRSVAGCLAPGEGTVGTKLEISHVRATPVGMKVVCETIVTLVDRRRIVFDVKVSDERGLIGEGWHERFVIENERFMRKVKTEEKDECDDNA